MTDESNVPDGINNAAGLGTCDTLSTPHYRNVMACPNWKRLAASPVVQPNDDARFLDMYPTSNAVSFTIVRKSDPAPSPAGEQVALPELDITDEDRDHADYILEGLDDGIGPSSAHMHLEWLYCRERQLAAALAQVEELAKTIVAGAVAYGMVDGIHPLTGPQVMLLGSQLSAQLAELKQLLADRTHQFESAESERNAIKKRLVLAHRELALLKQREPPEKAWERGYRLAKQNLPGGRRVTFAVPPYAAPGEKHE